MSIYPVHDPSFSLALFHCYGFLFFFAYILMMRALYIIWKNINDYINLNKKYHFIF